jgi:NTE family protein
MTPFGLALGGGGAAGLGNLAVLAEIEDAGVRPAAIAGTSIGALIGVAWAAGLSAERFETHVTELTSDVAGMGRRLLGGAKWSELGLGLFLDPEHILRVVLPDGLPDRIEDLPIPVTIVATDFYRQCEIRFTRGPLAPALAGSMAIPGLFRPVVVDGRVIVDGGVCNNLPIETLPEHLPVIAVDNVTNPPDDATTQVPGPLMTSIGAMRILMRALLERQLQDRAPFALLRPPSCRFGPMDFNRTRDILAAAQPIREETRAALRRLADLEATAD